LKYDQFIDKDNQYYGPSKDHHPVRLLQPRLLAGILDNIQSFTSSGDGPNYEDLSIAAILDLFPRPPQTINTTGASTTQFQSQQSLSTPVNQTGRRSSRSSSISIAVENPSQPQHQQQITTPLQSRFAASAATTNTVQIAPVSVSLGTLPGRSSGSLSPANPLASSTNNMGAATVSADGQFLDPDRFSYSLAPGIAEMDYIDLLKR
jgi:hypothetical protein